MIKTPQNKHRGQRAFIIGSGPSIKGMDLRPLKDEITICVNESYKALDFDPTYSCIGDRVLYPMIKDRLAKMASKIVCSTGLNGLVGADYPGENLDAVVPLNKQKNAYDDGFIWDMQQVYKAWNVVPEIVLPFVCWCGFDDVYLIGCDCTNNGYFYTDSIREDGTQQVFDNAMNCYDSISKMTLPTRIHNATVGGKLEAFPRVEYGSIVPMAGPTKIVAQPVEGPKMEAPAEVPAVKGSLKVVGYYTPDRNYQQLAEKMKASVEKQGVDCYIQERPSQADDNFPKPMPWVLNCAQCGFFIHDMMRKFPYNKLLYLDADAVMERPPVLLTGDTNFDFAVSFLTNKHVKDELTSNTIFFNNTPKAGELVEMWCTLQEVRNMEMMAGKYCDPFLQAWDQQVLAECLRKIKGLRLEKLPYTYAKITKTPKGEELMAGVDPNEIVISQYQASRQNKREV